MGFWGKLSTFAFIAGSALANHPTTDSSCGFQVSQGNLAIFRNVSPEPLVTPTLMIDTLLDRVERAIQSSAWNAHILDPQNPMSRQVLDAALSLFRAGRIRQSQFEYLTLRWQWWEDYGGWARAPMRTLPVLDPDGKLSLALQTHLILQEQEGRFPIDREMLRRLEREILQGDPADFQLSYFPVSKSNQPGHTEDPHAMTELLASFGKLGWLLPRGGNGEENAMFIPSVPLLNAVLRARYEESAIQVRAEFGVCPIDLMISDLEKGYRPMGIGFPGLVVAAKADEILTNRTGFTLHDIFHAVALSEIDHRYRHFVLRLRERTLAEYQRTRSASIREAIDSLTSLAIDGIPRFVMIHPDEQMSPMAWLKEDTGANFATLLPILRKDIAEHPEWYRAHRVTH